MQVMRMIRIQSQVSKGDIQLDHLENNYLGDKDIDSHLCMLILMDNQSILMLLLVNTVHRGIRSGWMHKNRGRRTQK